MALIDDLWRISRKLARRGWSDLFALHGLRLDDTTLRTPSLLSRELNRTLPSIDRTVAGFEDFSPTGCRGVQPGEPNRSLLFHAFASPLVRPLVEDETDDRNYPSLEELDIIENYIYARAKKSIKSLKRAGGRLVVGVFACHYRIGARSPDGKFADTAFSRTEIG